MGEGGRTADRRSFLLCGVGEEEGENQRRFEIVISDIWRKC